MSPGGREVRALRGSMAYPGTRQWAAVITHMGHTRKPPQMCSPFIWMEAMKGQEWGAAAFPPMIRLPWVPGGLVGASGHQLPGSPSTALARVCPAPGCVSQAPQHYPQVPGSSRASALAEEG